MRIHSCILAGLYVLAVCLISPFARASDGDRPQAFDAEWDWILDADSLPSPPPKVRYLGLDAFDTPKSYIRKAKDRRTTTWCYLSIGTLENWRPDRDAFQQLNDAEIQAGRPSIIGKRYPQWPGERWLNVKRYKVFLHLMVDRLRRCVRRGFKMVEFDNMDAYDNHTGLAIKRRHVRAYVKALAKAARDRGLSPIHKNAPQLTEALEPHFDAVLFESCVLYKFCDKAAPYRAAGKPVFNAEYPEAWKDEGRTFRRKRVCRKSAEAGAATIVKKFDLDDWVRHCP